jgi:type IV pilus assembly protein PilB
LDLQTTLNKRRKIGEVLTSVGLITETQLAQALEAQRTIPMPLGALLVHLGFVSEDIMLGVLAQEYGVEPWPLDQWPPSPEALPKVSAEICRTHLVLPVAVHGEVLSLAMANPNDVEAIEVVRYATRMQVEPFLATRFRLQQAIERLHGTGRIAQTVDQLVESAVKEVDVRVNDSAVIAEAESAPVINLVNQLFEEAIRAQASDIHIEPRKDRLEIRMRVDGQLHALRDLPITIQPMVVARIKIMADMDVSEFRLPQDGRMNQFVDGREIDLRVSVVPCRHGQRVVLRILDRFIGLRRLDEVGFTEHNLELFKELIHLPHGVLLVTGPTGSGKTTTLYGVLSELRDTSTNVMTCEDPIEYEVDGVNQTQINSKIGLTFARQLRALLRQDPDVMLVGEIRDQETAETAVRAALTGHLVLSTLHSNDALSTIPRLLDMGIEPFLLGTCLTGVVSQRLVRKLCPNCRETRMPTDWEQSLWHQEGREAPLLIPKAVGCPQCFNAGYRGRTAVHEILPVFGHVGELIANRATAEAIREEGVKWGYRPIQSHALDLIDEGLTTVEEARRVIHLRYLQHK